MEVVVQNTTKTRYALNEDDILRTRHIVGIAIRRQNSGDTAKSVTGATLVADNILAVSFLSLQSDNVNFLDRCPMDYLAVNPASENIQDRYVGLELPNGFNPTKSFIDIADVTNLAANEVFELTFIYKD